MSFGPALQSGVIGGYVSVGQSILSGQNLHHPYSGPSLSQLATSSWNNLEISRLNRLVAAQSQLLTNKTQQIEGLEAENAELRLEKSQPRAITRRPQQAANLLAA
jgi:hypothetical protein